MPVNVLTEASGRVASADMSTLDYASAVIQRLADVGPSLVLAPLAVGRPVGHVLFEGGHVPVVPEVHFVPGDPYCATSRPLTVAGGDLARKGSTWLR